ncbi:MAG: hypothetical protein C0623_13560 [Desulfuromonas sp.]|nr:MAG: hypothetical protein C0623_13560 [Desulfuromonas sp.]
MLKSIRNISSAVTDLTVIAKKEVSHQINSANEFCTDKTRIVAWRSSEIRKAYEDRLEQRSRKQLMIENMTEDQYK